MHRRVNKRPQTSDIVVAHKLRRNQITINLGVCIVDQFNGFKRTDLGGGQLNSHNATYQLSAEPRSMRCASCILKSESLLEGWTFCEALLNSVI
jgi:hypothetical protein